MVKAVQAVESATLPGVAEADESSASFVLQGIEVRLVRTALGLYAKSLARSEKAEEAQVVKAFRREQFEAVMRLHYKLGGAS